MERIWVDSPAVDQARPSTAAAFWALFVLTAIYALNIADRYVIATLIEPIRREFELSDSALGLVTGAGLAIFYVTAGIPLGVLADRVNRKKMILAAVAAWSVMTMVCGLSQTFVQLLLARIGVGVGEAGGTPPSQSMLADYFPRNKRALATSLYALGVPIGSALGGIVAAIMAERFGWRAALFAAAAMSVPVLVLTLTLREPARGRFDEGDQPDSSASKAGLSGTLSFIRTNKAAFHLIAGATVATFSGMGLIWWTPAFLTRSHGLTVEQAGLQVGAMNGIGGTIAIALSAVLMVWLSRRPTSTLAWFLAIVTGFITLPAAVAHWTADAQVSIGCLWLVVALANVYIGPTLALLHNMFPPTMRGTAVAVILFTANIANLLVAPQGIGALSDLLRDHLADPESSLRVALLISSFTGLWGAWHFVLAARALRKDD